MRKSDEDPHEIRYLGVTLSPEVGADDLLVSLRILPDGREGNTVFARTLLQGEKDTGAPVIVNPAKGERLEFREGAILLTIQDVDRSALVDEYGYAPLTNLLWTWLALGGTLPNDMRRLLLAAGKRLDASSILHAAVLQQLHDLPHGFIRQRDQVFRAVCLAEMLVIALWRSTELLTRLQVIAPNSSLLPSIVVSKKSAVGQMRHAFEHIDERALGQIRGRLHPDAVLAFDQTRLLRERILTVGRHSLDLQEEAPQILSEARKYVYELLINLTGAVRVAQQRTGFFDSGEA